MTDFSWLNASCVAAREAPSPGRALLASFVSDWERAESLRRAILACALCTHLRQRPNEVRRELSAYFEGRFNSPIAVDSDSEVRSDGLVEVSVTEGHAPLGVLFDFAVQALDDPALWEAWVAQDPAPAAPVAWLGLAVARRVQSRLRVSGARRSKSAERRPLHERLEGQLRLAAMLETLREVDPDEGGSIEGFRGVYARLLRGLDAELTDYQPHKVAAFTLRQLFPSHAWSGVDQPGNPRTSPRAEPLMNRLATALGSVWAGQDFAEAAVALSGHWETTRVPASIPDALDIGAEVHLSRDSSLELAEVLEWVGRAVWPSVTKMQRPIARMVEDLEPEVEAAFRELVATLQAEVSR